LLLGIPRYDAVYILSGAYNSYKNETEIRTVKPLNNVYTTYKKSPNKIFRLSENNIQEAIKLYKQIMIQVS
jgi:hypothetical protein